MKKFVSFILTLLAVAPFFFIPTSAVQAASSSNQPDSSQVCTIPPAAYSADFYAPSSPQGTVAPQSAAVAVFFAGMVVAWVVDGTIKYATGRAPSDWVALGRKTIEQSIRNLAKSGYRSINVSQNGYASGCIAYPCMIREA